VVVQHQCHQKVAVQRNGTNLHAHADAIQENQKTDVKEVKHGVMTTVNALAPLVRQCLPKAVEQERNGTTNNAHAFAQTLVPKLDVMATRNGMTINVLANVQMAYKHVQEV
jgi:hypothetical protein